MSKNNKQSKAQNSKPSLLQALLTRPDRDKEYQADLSAQWESMTNGERVKFIAGGLFALVIIIAALVGVYLLINYLRQLIF